MQTKVKKRDRVRKTILGFGSFILVLLAIICPPLQWSGRGEPNGESLTIVTHAVVKVLHVPSDYATIQIEVTAFSFQIAELD